jgi:hypothetical protein
VLPHLSLEDDAVVPQPRPAPELVPEASGASR